jgi:hypothetical protein
MRSLLVNHRGGLAAALAEIVGLNLRHIRDPLGQGAVDPGFCRAVFTVAQQIRGVETMDAGVDQTGRSGTGLAQTLGRHRFELIFSTDLGELLGYQSFFAQPMAYAPAGALQSWCAYPERRIDLSLPADVPPSPRRRGERARAGRGLLIRPGFSIVTGSAQDPLKQLAELHGEGVLTDADYESAKVMQAWAGFDDATASAWRALGMRPAEAVELTRAGSQPIELAGLWERTGIPEGEIAGWIGAGVTPSEAVDQRAQGVSAEDAAAMRGFRGIDRLG